MAYLNEKHGDPQPVTSLSELLDIRPDITDLYIPKDRSLAVLTSDYPTAHYPPRSDFELGAIRFRTTPQLEKELKAMGLEPGENGFYLVYRLPEPQRIASGPVEYPARVVAYRLDDDAVDGYRLTVDAMTLITRENAHARLDLYRNTNFNGAWSFRLISESRLAVTVAAMRRELHARAAGLPVDDQFTDPYQIYA